MTDGLSSYSRYRKCSLNTLESEFHVTEHCHQLLGRMPVYYLNCLSAWKFIITGRVTNAVAKCSRLMALRQKKFTKMCKCSYCFTLTPLGLICP